MFGKWNDNDEVILAIKGGYLECCVLMESNFSMSVDSEMVYKYASMRMKAVVRANITETALWDEHNKTSQYYLQQHDHNTPIKDI